MLNLSCCDFRKALVSYNTYHYHLTSAHHWRQNVTLLRGNLALESVARYDRNQSIVKFANRTKAATETTVYHHYWFTMLNYSNARTRKRRIRQRKYTAIDFFPRKRLFLARYYGKIRRLFSYGHDVIRSSSFALSLSLSFSFRLSSLSLSLFPPLSLSLAISPVIRKLAPGRSVAAVYQQW